MPTTKIATVAVVALALPILFLAATTGTIISTITSGATTHNSTNSGALDTSNPCVTAPGHNPIAGHTTEQMTHAATIMAVGQRMNVPPRGWIIAIAAALQESGLRNLNYGDHDSLGLFQQRPSQGWGTPTQILDPTYAATQFYRHLLALPNWPHMTVNDAAQAVQRSATPTAYARHEPAARALVNAVQTACATAHTP